ncbi:MAG: bifunctional sulfate adenylyltransferase/adenylylsulfate kinase, partial [Thermodesulfobacteriota bacterium]|nr:bifunctional sulfate adenylyltransferase/adenylylsulfate kinase [Thermodesulfobacteriota bacterium]
MKPNNDYSESLLVHFRRIEELKKASLEYPSVELNKRQLCDLELLLNRAFYPLLGYLNREDYESVLENARLQDGTVWPIPICLDVNEKLVRTIQQGTPLALRDEEGFMLAVLTVNDIWKPDKKKEAICIFGTEDSEKHPGVRYLYNQVEEWYLGGSLQGIQLPIHYDFKEMRLTPAEIHRQFSQKGWRKVVGFQTEKNLHCAHKEMTLKVAREAGASIFLQPIVGFTHPGDIDHYTRVRCYQEIVKKYPPNMIMLGLIPLAMRMAGPREALWQAMIRKNYGCSHFMVADDHGDPFANNTGAERFYPLHSAQEMVKEYEKETRIQMVPLKKMVYVEDKAQYIPADEVQSGMKVMHISSSELRRRLENDLEIPEWFSYPEVVKELRWACPPRAKQGFTIFLTGLSGAGKSTIAKVLMVKFMEMRDRPVTLLDGDIVRKNLSSELNFSKGHRNLNITRIGFVASEITKNGGIAICAPIAPYEESRREVRELISRYGGFIEAYISTPLNVCEQRDRKGIYAKARSGKIKGFTGVDDPYIPPSNAEI